MPSEKLKHCTPERARSIFDRACSVSDRLVNQANDVVVDFAKSHSLSTDDLCFVVVGSVGRSEALEASDFDFIPLSTSPAALAQYLPLDKKLRGSLATTLGVKVSQGADLTKPISLDELTEADCIGGGNDNSSALTKRILILTESRQVGGGLAVDEVRRRILDAYASQDRTSGRHVLSFCNDVARYYKTLCIEYKAKIDDEEKDWCTRNLKLRHSRKFWYFSNIISIVKLSEQYPLGEAEYTERLLEVFALSPPERIVQALVDSHPIEVGQLLESYSFFLDFMADADNRSKLAAVEHHDRYAKAAVNPFPAMKLNSDLLHRTMLETVDALPRALRVRVLGWFLL